MHSAATGGSPLVCVHGFSGSWRHWMPIVPGVERHHRVHVARLTGHADGPGFPTGSPVTVTAVADELERHLDRHGVGDAHLVGNSLGGWLALELAVRGRALSVTALSPALGWPPSGAHLRNLRIKLVAARRVFSAMEPFAETAFKFGPIRRTLFSGAMARSERLPVTDLVAFVRDNLSCSIYHDLMRSFLSTEAVLGQIDCPVHIAWSELDALIPWDPYGQRFPALVPHARFSTIPGVGHVPMFDDPGLVSRVITDFTTAVDAGRLTK